MFVICYVGADRLTNFDINVISSSGTRTLCARYTDPAPPGRGNVTVTCSPPLVGQYVHFIRTGGPRMDAATLCEVVVIGHLYTGKVMIPSNIILNDRVSIDHQFIDTI